MTLRAEWTRYAVPGWGVGELWTDDGLVLAHEFAFTPVSNTGSAVALDRSAADRPHVYESRSEVDRARADQPSGAIGAHSKSVPRDRNRCLTPGDLVERLNSFLAGEDVSLADVPLDLDWTTPFQRSVAEILRALPRGEVVSYGELAALAGYPGAARAVGTLCARNRFMFFVPCHRVVGAGGIGGYGSAGVRVKRRLLELEGVRL
jgi:O-6-methylguanine DNA methyltransferase